MESTSQNYLIPPALKTVRGYLSSLDVSNDYLAYFNGTTVVLQPHNQSNIILYFSHLSDVCAIKFSPDGRLIASIDCRGSLIISEICPNKVIVYKKYDNVFPNAKGLDWTADKKRICVVGEGKNQFGRVILIETGTNAGQINGVAGNVNSCSFRSERPYKLALGGDENTIKFYQGPPYSFVKSDRSHQGYINQIKYSPKGTYILSGGADRKLVLYDGLKQEKIGQKQNAHNGGIFGLDWINQDHFVTCSSDKLIKIWNIQFQEVAVIQAGSAEDLKNTKKIGLFLVAVRVYKNVIYAANLQGDILVYKNPIIQKQTGLITTYSGSRSKIIKVIPIGNKGLILLDSAGRILYHCMESRKTSAIDPVIQIKLISNGFASCSNDQVWIFLLLEDNSVAILNSPLNSINFKFMKKIEEKLSKFIAPSLNSHSFVGVNNDELFIFDAAKNQLLGCLKIEEEATAIAFNSQYVAVGTIKGKVKIYDNKLGLIYSGEVKTFKVSVCTFIPSLNDEDTLVLIGDSCGHMKLIGVKDKVVEAVKETMGGHSSLITAVDFDQKWIYTFSMDGKVNLWNRKTYSRDQQLNDLVKGGIISGASFTNKLIIVGGDLMTQVIKKVY